MSLDNNNQDPQRPFKVFLSLLDKWEIGYALTDAMILDALQFLEQKQNDGDSVSDEAAWT